jgi:uncharacterized membrane protein YgdD (TMEM256/DUF423 family)
MNSNRWIATGALLGAIGVTVGAFGAHGLREVLESLAFSGDELAKRLGNYETAVRYQMYHALAIALVGVAYQQRPNKAWQFAAWAFLIGILLFSGLLYVLVFAGPAWNWLGAVVPIGGAAYIVGWICLAIAALRT